MSTATKAQLFLLVLILGFLTGPRVMLAIQKLTPTDEAVLADTDGTRTASVASSSPAMLAKVTPTPYARLHLQAKSVYVWDIKTHRKLYGLNEQTPLPLASVTKMMTAMVAKELLPEKQPVTIAPIDLREEGDSGFLAGEHWSLDDLIGFTLVTSSNDGASAIARVASEHLASTDKGGGALIAKKIFIEKMNEKARTIGLDHTHFVNESGLDVDSLTPGAAGSSRDMAMLFEYIFRKHPDLFMFTTYAQHNFTSEDHLVHSAVNTNPEVAHLSGMIGSKTGYTDLAGGNLAVIVDIGIDHPVVIVVLGSTREGRFSDVAKLINATVEEITGSQLPSL